MGFMKEKRDSRKKQNQDRRPKKRIRDEIMFGIGKSVLVVFLAVAVVTIFMVRNVVVSTKETELTLESEACANQIDGFFAQYEKAARQLAVDPELKEVLSETGPGDDILKAKKMDTVLQNLISTVKADPENFMTAWIADLDASVLTQSDGFTSDKDWDVTTRPWYSCTETGEPVLTEPFVDTSTGEMIMSAVAPVFADSGEVLGVAGLDIVLDHMSDTMVQYKVGNKGYVMLLASDGTVIYHPDENLVHQQIKETDISQNVLDAIEAGEEQFLKYKAGGTTKYGVVGPVGSTGFTVISNLPLSEFYGLLVNVCIALVIVYAVGTLMIVLSIRRSAASLTRPILELNHAAQQLAAGDLDVELTVTSEDEIGELGDSFGETVNRLKEYIAYIDETAEVLGHLADGKLSINLKHDYVGEFQKLKVALINISDSMNDVMESINTSASQVEIGSADLSEASQMLAAGAGAQAVSVQEASNATISVSEQVQESRKDAEHSAEATDKVADMMQKNQEKMRHMMEAMDKIRDTSQQVVGIIQAIEDIAGQTNLLSLNASIEAARAGEEGRGFSVVANQIGTLALESSKAANMTRELIGVSLDEIGKGSTIADDVMASLEESVSAVEQVRDMINKTAESAVTQADNMEQIRTIIDELNQGVQDNSAAAEETSATSQELASQATILSGLVQRFELCKK